MLYNYYKLMPCQSQAAAGVETVPRELSPLQTRGRRIDPCHGMLQGKIYAETSCAEVRRPANVPLPSERPIAVLS